LEVAMQVVNGAPGMRCTANEALGADPVIHGGAGREGISQQELGHPGRVGRVATTDGRGEPKSADRRVDLGPIHDVASVEDGVMSGLSVPGGQLLKGGANAHMFGASLVMGESQPEKLV